MNGNRTMKTKKKEPWTRTSKQGSMHIQKWTCGWLRIAAKCTGIPPKLSLEPTLLQLGCRQAPGRLAKRRIVTEASWWLCKTSVRACICPWVQRHLPSPSWILQTRVTTEIDSVIILPTTSLSIFS